MRSTILREIASDEQPLNTLIKPASFKKGAVFVPDAVNRYMHKISKAIAADEDDNVFNLVGGI